MSVYVVRKKSKRGPAWDKFHVRMKTGGNGPVKVLEVHDDEAVANRRADEIRTAIETGERAPTRVPAHLRHATLGEVADAFIAEKAASGKAKPNTLQGYRTNRKQLGRLADLPARAITEEDVQDWINDHLGGRLGMQPSTIRTALVRCRLFLDAAKVTPNPARAQGIERPPIVTVARELPTWGDLMAARENLEAVAMESPQTTDRYMPELFGVLLHGGLRIAEALALQWRNVDRRRMRLVAVPGKLGRLRNVEVLPFQGDWLPVRPEGVADTDPIFRLSRDHARVLLAESSSGADLPHLHPHLLRHWHGSYLMATMPDHRMPPATIARRMGHSVAVLFDTYTHEIVPDDAPEALVASSLR